MREPAAARGGGFTMRHVPVAGLSVAFPLRLANTAVCSFYKASRWPSMTVMCLRLGGGAILLAAVARSCSGSSLSKADLKVGFDRPLHFTLTLLR